MVVSMKQTLSEFMGCMEWDKGELCDLIDQLRADVKARDELIRDMLEAKIKEATAMNLATGERFFFGQDAEEICNWKERMKVFGIEVDNDES